LEKSAVSIVVDAGLLLDGVGYEFEEVLLGMEEGRGFEFAFGSVDETRVDGSGMMILVPRCFPSPSALSTLDAPAEEYTSPDSFGVLIDSNRGASELV
jgi:hypothetical protein